MALHRIIHWVWPLREKSRKVALQLCPLSPFLSKENTHRILSISNIEEDIQHLSYALSHCYVKRHQIPNFYDTLMQLHRIQKPCFTQGHLKQHIQHHLSLFHDKHLVIHQTHHARLPVPKVTFMNNTKQLNVDLPHFLSPEEQWQQLLNTLEHYREKASSIVIDLRANRGGNRALMYGLLDVLLGKKVDLAPNRTITRERFDDPSCHQLQLNQMMVQGISRPTLMAIKPKSYHQPPLKQNKRTLHGSPQTHQPIIILTSQDTASTSEHFILALTHYPKRIIIGQMTQGAIETYAPGLCVLPNSSIWVDIPSTQIIYEGMDFSQKGIQPDHETSSRLEILRLIQQYGQ